MVDVVMEMKFSINKYSQVINRVGTGYAGLANFMIINQYAAFPGEGYNFSFPDVEFHAVSSAPTLLIIQFNSIRIYLHANLTAR
jgi:hypothetical protein